MVWEWLLFDFGVGFGVDLVIGLVVSFGFILVVGVGLGFGCGVVIGVGVVVWWFFGVFGLVVLMVGILGVGMLLS